MKKRSLLAAVAMLLVAILAATGTTYAWFTESGSATASVSMAVSQGQSLEISTDGQNWFSSVKLLNDGTKWEDFSTNSTDIANGKYYTKTLKEGTSEIIGYTEATPATATLYFRSTNPNAVKMSGTLEYEKSQTETRFNTLLSYARVTFNGKIYATASGTTEDTITGTSVDDVNGSYTVDAIGTGDDEAVALTLNTTTGYYESGAITVSYWVEGTKVDNGHSNGLTSNLNSVLTFDQVAQNP